MTSAVEPATTEKPAFTLPYESYLDTPGWGPLDNDQIPEFCLGDMAFYPFEPTTKQERLGRVCDFTYITQQRNQRDGKVTAQQGDGDTVFQLVDSRNVKNRYQNRGWGGGPNRRPPFRRDGPGGGQMGGGGGGAAGQGGQQQHRQAQHTPQQGFRDPRGGGGQGGGHTSAQQRYYQYQQQQRQQQWQRTNRQRLLAEWSVEPQHDWTLIESFTLSTLSSYALPASQVSFEDLEWRGELRPYKREYDKVLAKSPVVLSDDFMKRFTFYWPGTADDPYIVKTFDSDTSLDVAATDQLLACLMTAAQSRISWHLIFHKVNNRLFIDKQNGSSVDMVTVDETHRDAPLSDNPVRLNRPAELSTEALRIQQNFSQQALERQGPPVVSHPPPSFVEEKDVPASKAYRYRVITLPPMHTSAAANAQGTTDLRTKPLRVLIRSEIDGVLSGGSLKDFVSIRVLNEYNPSRSTKPWKTQLEGLQKGALLAQETKNNQCKVAKWVCQAVMAGVQTMKIGFVTRTFPDANEKHNILNVQTFRTRDLGIQVNLREDNIWGITRTLFDQLMAQPDGRYTLIKDPIKPEMKLYNTQADVHTML